LPFDDCGKVINPMLVDDNCMAASCNRLGKRCFEEVVYDEQGQMVTGTLMIMPFPGAATFPGLNWEEPKRLTGKSAGSEGRWRGRTIGATPAIVGAVVDALAPLA